MRYAKVRSNPLFGVRLPIRLYTHTTYALSWLNAKNKKRGVGPLFGGDPNIGLYIHTTYALSWPLGQIEIDDGIGKMTTCLE